MNEVRTEPDTDELAAVDADPVERAFAPPSRSPGTSFVSHAGVRLAKLIGVLAVLGVIPLTVLGLTSLPGDDPRDTVAVADGGPTDGEAVDADAPAPDTADGADAPVRGDSTLTAAYTAAAGAAAPTNGDRAYCPDDGRVVHVGATRTYRGTLCAEGGQLVYHGLSKTSEERVLLPGQIEGDTVLAAGDGGFTYSMTESSLQIRQNGTVVAEEDMLYWWPRGHAELELPGDLGLSRPITYPACDGSIAVIAASVFDPPTTTAQLETLLGEHPGAEYLRTDLSCDNFRGPSSDNSNGHYIYAVYYTMDAAQETEACALAEELGGYADWMQDGVDPHGRIECA